jgi:DNA-binding transcriptional ArsR family regulator
VNTEPVIGGAALARAVEVLQGMAYEHRLHILLLLRAGEATPTMLAEVVPAHATAVAHHLRHLVAAGLIRRRRNGRRVVYSLPNEATGRLIDEVLRYVGSGALPGSGS